MEFKPDVENVLRRYQAFWNHELSSDRPAVQIQIPSQVEPPEPLSSLGRDQRLAYYERVFEERLALRDDTLPILSTFAYVGHTLLPSLLGAPVAAGGGSVWSGPILDKLEDFRRLQLDWRCDAWRRFQDFYRQFADASRGRFCLPLHLAKSPGELMSALRGPQRLVLDFFDQPELVREYGRRCLALSIEYGKRILEDVQLTEIGEGHVYCYANWVPKDTACFSEDYTANWSPAIYREFIRPLDVAYIKAFSVSNMEWHSGCAHVFADFPEVDAVEFNLDPSHRSITDALADLRPRMRKTRFLVPCKKDEVRAVMEAFGPRCLMIVTSCSGVSEGNRLLDDITQWTQELQQRQNRHRAGELDS